MPVVPATVSEAVGARALVFMDAPIARAALRKYVYISLVQSLNLVQTSISTRRLVSPQGALTRLCVAATVDAGAEASAVATAPSAAGTGFVMGNGLDRMLVTTR